MSITQKYLQKTRQVRIQTNNTTYAYGMQFVDNPLAEGACRVLVNFDINSITGELSPRQGLQDIQNITTEDAPAFITPDTQAVIIDSKLCTHADPNNARKTIDILQTILYNIDTLAVAVLSIVLPITENTKYKLTTLTQQDVGGISGYVLDTPEIHNKRCKHNKYFKTNVGAFAFNNNYYTFLGKRTTPLIRVQTKEALDQIGEYFVDNVSSEITYINNDSEETVWENHNLQDFLSKALIDQETILVYTKLGAELSATEIQLIKNANPDWDPDWTPDWDRYYMLQIVPQELNPSEASNLGYNMLLKDPYTFLSERGSGDINAMSVLGAMLYKDNILALNPRINTTYTLKVYLSTVPVVDEVHIVVRARSASEESWTQLFNEQNPASYYYAAGETSAKVLEIPFTPNAEGTYIQIQISDPTETQTVIPSEGEPYTTERVINTLPYLVTANSDTLANNLNLNVENYDLGKGYGMCAWEQRLVVWGISNALNTVFISDVNNPTYFPYPNNVDVFQDPIISIKPYGNELLVLTTTALYRLSYSTALKGLQHTLVQRNLHIVPNDMQLMVPLKNMLFFKSENKFYLTVPKTSSGIVGELSVTNISKTIEKLLDNFHEIVYNLGKVLINQGDIPDFTNDLINYYVYTNGLKIVMNYVYDLSDTVSYQKVTEKPEDWDSTYTNYYQRYTYIDNTTKNYFQALTQYQEFTSGTFYKKENTGCLTVQLIYDTELRNWSLKMFQVYNRLKPLYNNVLEQNDFIECVADGTDLILVTKQFTNTTQDSNNLFKVLGNYQYFDTGNYNLNTDMKKRFREFQFKFKNTAESSLRFYTGFLIDGSYKKNLQKYNAYEALDEDNNPCLVVESVLEDIQLIRDDGELVSTVLAESENTQGWELNNNALAGRNFCKIRLLIAGKGYTPRAILVNRNEQNYSILGHNWVYRTTNGR